MSSRLFIVPFKDLALLFRQQRRWMQTQFCGRSFVQPWMSRLMRPAVLTKSAQLEKPSTSVDPDARNGLHHNRKSTCVFLRSRE